MEGYGDAQAVPTLVAKTGLHFGYPAIAPDPIRAGEWKLLRRAGVLEKYLDLAASRNWDKILVVLDLEDDCAVSEAEAASRRVMEWMGQRDLDVEIIYLVREYETLFLWCPEALGNIDRQNLPADPEGVRGAKERVTLLTGRRYKETQDQLRYTQALDLNALYALSRSYRRFCKALTGLDYGTLSLLI